MPADFFIDTQLGIVFSKAKGPCSHADALDHMNRLLRHPDFNPEFNQLIDYREMTEANLSHEEVKTLAHRKIFSPRSKRAFVAPHDEQFGIGRMFATYREMEGEPGIQIFREMTEALAWLSLTTEPDPNIFVRFRSPAGEHL